MKYEVKSEDGQLAIGSLAEVQALYRQGFIGPTDLVKPENSSRWVPAGQMPVLKVTERHSSSQSRMAYRVAFAILFSGVLGGIFLHQRNLALTSLVLMAVLTPFVVYRPRRR
jgi:hypothetical protein